MRTEYTRARNLVRLRRRQGRRDDSLEIAAKIAKHDFHHAIEKRKQERWTGLFKELNAYRAEKIPAIGCEPWSPKAHVHILDKEAARLATAVEQSATIDLYTDGSVRNG